MKLLIQSAMIFFGTLFAAGVVALGEPGGDRLAIKPMPAAATIATIASPAASPAKAFPDEAMGLTVAEAPR